MNTTNTLAIGVLSTIGFEQRRAAVRESWMTFRSPTTVTIEFVLRCGGLPARHALRREADVLCSPVPHTEGRLRGPLLAMLWWFEYAANSNASFIAKADDDVYVHVPDLLRIFRAIPPDVASLAYFGFHGFYSLVVNGTDHRFAAWADNHANALAVQRAQRFAQRCHEPHTTCYGPFPMACGPFVALGSSAVRALLRAPHYRSERERLLRLPRETSRPVLDDAWLGAALWRLVGQSAALHVFSLATAWGRIYADTAGFVVSRSVTIFHNRHKMYNRLRVLHGYSLAAAPPAPEELVRCTSPITWRVAGLFQPPQALGARLVAPEPMLALPTRQARHSAPEEGRERSGDEASTTFHDRQRPASDEPSTTFRGRSYLKRSAPSLLTFGGSSRATGAGVAVEGAAAERHASPAGHAEARLGGMRPAGTWLLWEARVDRLRCGRRGADAVAGGAGGGRPRVDRSARKQSTHTNFNAVDLRDKGVLQQLGLAGAELDMMKKER